MTDRKFAMDEFDPLPEKENVECKCGKAGIKRPCPYAYEIHDDETPCTCCEECRDEHRGDI